MAVVLAENETLFWAGLEVPKKAVPVGTAFGVQLPLVLKSPVPLRFQVASCAAAGSVMAISAEVATNALRTIAPSSGVPVWPLAPTIGPMACGQCGTVPVAANEVAPTELV